jgi:outer membrane protein OmpA-like peptidoglycan-associated protein
VGRAATLTRDSGPAAILALQRSAGNRRTLGALFGPERPAGAPAPAPARTLSRCSGQCTCGGACGKHDDELEALASGALRRAVAARAALPARPRLLQRDIVPVPPYRPNPPWSKVGRNNPPPTCTPYSGLGDICPEGALTWRFLFSVADAPKTLEDRCHCSTVGTAYSLFMRAQEPRSRRTFFLADNGNCVSEQLAKSRTHGSLETSLLNKWKAIEKAQIPLILSGGTREAEIDLVEAADSGKIVPADPSASLTEKNVDTDITYGENNLAGGLLFGGGSEDNERSDDSEFGPDTRRLTGTIKLRRFDDGSNPARMSIEETVTFKYAMHDALDFCPGNTLQKDTFTVDRFEYNEAITDLSRLEASGMARDVGFDVKYHRTTAFTSDIPLKAPSPVPKKIVTLPAEVLFDFDHDHPREAAEKALLAALGDKPSHQDPGKIVEVRGHTDGKGSASYNQGLSERRANAIKELLEKNYPNLVGRVHVVGLGATQPIAPNTQPDGSDNPAGRAVNRRVDIEFDIDVP